jgi:hypothetical protein
MKYPDNISRNLKIALIYPCFGLINISILQKQNFGYFAIA